MKVSPRVVLLTLMVAGAFCMILILYAVFVSNDGGDVLPRCATNYHYKKPKLSITLATQGGTYGDISLKTPARRGTNRLLRQLWWISECAEKYQLSVEVVILDYPLESPSSLKEEILESLARAGKSLPNRLRQLRIIEGSPELLAHSLPTLSVLEYFGKNIAARRCLGDFILLGGTDSLPHESFFAWIKNLSLWKVRSERKPNHWILWELY